MHLACQAAPDSQKDEQMTDVPQLTVPPPAPLTAGTEAPNAQLIVAVCIVIGLVLVALSAIGASLVDRSVSAVAFGAVGVVVGSLATALNTPTGIANVIATAKKNPDPQS